MTAAGNCVFRRGMPGDEPCLGVPGNAATLAFHPLVGCRDAGSTTYVMAGRGCENRVFVKPLD